MLKLVVPDVDQCTGCRICQMVCSLSHEGECNPRLARLQMYRDRHKGVDIPIICQHCENAPCKAVCPTRAITKNHQSGVVLVNQDLCIGCGMCVQACPFGMIVLSPKTHKSMKCDLCDGDPKCVIFCPTEAIKFIELSQTQTLKTRAYGEQFREALLKSRGLSAQSMGK